MRNWWRFRRRAGAYLPPLLIHKPCSYHPERKKSHGVIFSQSNPTQGRARSGIYNGFSLCSVCLAQSNQSLPFKGGGIAKQWRKEFLGIKILNFIMHAYSFSRLRRQLPRGGSLRLVCANILVELAMCAKIFQYESFWCYLFSKR